MTWMEFQKKIKDRFRIAVVRDATKFFLFGLINKIGQHNDFLFAGGLAFSFFLCIMPFILVIFAIIGHVLAIPSVEEQVNIFILRFIPHEKSALFVQEVIFSRVEEFKAFKSIAGYIGGIGLFIAASGLFTSMRKILNTIYQVESSKNIVIGKLRDLGMVFLVLSFFVLSMGILPIFEIVQNLAEEFLLVTFFQFDLIQNILFWLASFILVFVLFYILYFFIPYDRLDKKVIGVSAFCAALLWQIAKVVFGYYVSNIASLNRIYGAYMFMVVFAFWIYYSGITFIAGAEIGQLYREWKNREST